jgi:ComF family protein
MRKQFTALVRAGKDLCFPPACLACGARLPDSAGPLFCASCAPDVRLVAEPLCRCCGRAFPWAAGGNHTCGPCLRKPWHFSAARAVLHYSDPVSQAVQAFKYRGSTTGLATFRQLKERLHHLDCLADADLIVPVPLHVLRLRERGFNQALVLARALFPEQRRRISPFLLARIRQTVSQTGLSGRERRRNLKNAFSVVAPKQVAKKRILLIDDIFTTGSTVNECARTLRRAGALEVRVLTLARVAME